MEQKIKIFLPKVLIWFYIGAIMILPEQKQNDKRRRRYEN